MATVAPRTANGVANDPPDFSDAPTATTLTDTDDTTRPTDHTGIKTTDDADVPTSEKPAAPPQKLPAPNGGVLAWIQVAASFCIFFNTWGVLNTFGVFQTYYESGALFQESSSNISWIGAMQAYCVLVVGLASGPIYDRGYFRALLVTGSFLIVFGFMMLSICTTYWQALLAQGFCVGIGAGLIFVPSLAVLPAYFSTRLGLAIGLAASGSSLGGIIYPFVFYRLLGQVGFPWAVRAVAFIALGTLLIPSALMRMGFRPPKPRAVLDWDAFTDWPFALFTVIATIGFIGLYVMLFYVSYFAFATGIAGADMAFYLVPILNAASMFGRTLPNALADKTGPFNLLAPGAIICGALTYSLIGVRSLGGVVVVTFLYGFFSGVFIALPPLCFFQLTADKSKMGTRMGMGFACLGFGVLIGGPGGGRILGTDLDDLHWTKLWAFGGSASMASGLLLCALRLYLSKGKLWVKM
ncbi:major facilitator superfamily transporter monocarboxylate [Podospora didyma]|uniref:Major facilitator superfamily transporter monocarboxylate n=1 Tax=Podospora didyma TaxID=330526 RepID=A0AAE0KAM2_9PEZI|nr:major facilitator superfamily transporter monocarboxylate [Podospora didyma]